jgi:hypothetical protein
VILDLGRIDSLKENQDFILEALLHFLVMVREKMLLPYYVERWSLLIDANDAISLNGLQEFLQGLMTTIRTHFASTLHKIYLMNLHLMIDKVAED